MVQEYAVPDDAAYDPGGQSEQELAPSAENVPAAQGLLQAVARPVVAEYHPDAQGEQAVEPVPIWYCPAGHEAQEAW